MEAADFCFMAPSVRYKMDAVLFSFMALYSGQNIEAVDSSIL
jgi:hypothetical protein